MDVLVVLEEGDGPGPASSGARPLAYVQSGPEPAGWERSFERRGARPGREVITLCGAPSADALALALAAAVEGRRLTAGPAAAVPAWAVRHLRVTVDRGAAGDSAWRDRESGQLVSRDVLIAAGVLQATARQLLADAGRAIRQTAAELAAPEWPEGARRAISFAVPVAGDRPGGDEALLALLREADGYAAAYYDEPA